MIFFLPFSCFFSLVCIVVKVYLHCPIGYYVVTSPFLLFILPFRVFTVFPDTYYCIPILDRYLLFVVVNDTIFA